MSSDFGELVEEVVFRLGSWGSGIYVWDDVVDPVDDPVDEPDDDPGVVVGVDAGVVPTAGQLPRVTFSTWATEQAAHAVA